jgi:four helix bundle protein
MEDQQFKKSAVKTYKDLNVYQLSYDTAMSLFDLSKDFPKEETYSLTDQIRRSSRSIPANISEGWAKRKYRNVFIKHLHIANGSCEETKTWLDFAKNCNYLPEKEHLDIYKKYDQIGAMLTSLIKNWV